MSHWVPSRRKALASLASLVAASPCLRAQIAPRETARPRRRVTPLDEFESVPGLEAAARQSLSARAFERIAGGDRAALDRITFRPRMMVNTKALDVSLDLLGTQMFAPILVGPASRQSDFHPAGERETAAGAAAAQATIVSAEGSGTPFSETVKVAPGAWRQLYPDRDEGALIARAREADAAGAAAICLTLGDSAGDRPARVGWDTVDRLNAALDAPVVLKGIMHAQDAAEAARRGVAAVVVSNHGSRAAEGHADPMALLPTVAESVGGRIPVLVDGGFRRGGDVLKAIALGASAVLVCRPVMWGLAAYAGAGVQKVVEMLQTELARDMVQIGAVNLAAVRRDHVRIHSR